MIVMKAREQDQRKIGKGILDRTAEERKEINNGKSSRPCASISTAHCIH